MMEKYVKGYFALSRLLVSDFLLFNVLFWSSIKVQNPGVPDFGVLGSESWVLSPRSRDMDPVSRVPGPWSWVLGPGSRVPRVWVLGSYF